LEQASRELINKLKKKEIRTKKELERYKKIISKKYRLNSCLKNSELLAFCTQEEKDDLIFILRKRPVRSISGVAVVAVMTKPFPCPHANAPCFYCPGGPTKDGQGSPQSYTGLEPAALRSIQNDYDPYRQTKVRLEQLKAIGHPIDKIDLIIMGGTFSATPFDYQEFFVKGCLDAITETRSENLEEAKKNAEKSRNRLIGLTIETRPDCCKQEHVNSFLNLSATRVEIGVQVISDEVYKRVNRGHTVQDVVEAFQILRDNSLKVTAHMMPFLPGVETVEENLAHFKTLFYDSRFIPDEIKIYPTQVIEGTKLHQAWKKGEYHAPSNEELIRLLVEVKKIIPPHVRIKRILRDIPAYKIIAGCKQSNIREVVQEEMKKQGFKCQCLRCREVGHLRLKKGIIPDPNNIKFVMRKYEASNGIEYFLSHEDPNLDVIIGFCRLRIPSHQLTRAELSGQNVALIRELHVYGQLAEIGSRPNKGWQHRGFGKNLLKEAERISTEHECQKLVVISGIGAREYYYKLGFHLDGPFVSKNLSP